MTTSRLITGDCLDVMPTLPADSVHAIVCDPPYGLEFMGKEWDKLWAKRDKSEDLTGKSSSPFLAARVDRYVAGKQAQAWHHRWATEALRVVKPGAFLLAFGGTRTFHRLTCALEDAGWEIRDCVMWLYGSGFPKSLDVSKAIDKAAGAEREVATRTEIAPANLFSGESKYEATSERGWDNSANHFVPGKDHTQRLNVPITTPATDAAKQWDGWGTALKPAWEPIIVARKPLDGTVANNVLKHGCGGLNVDGCRIEAQGRPAISSHGDGYGTGPAVSGYGDGLSGSRAAGVTNLGRWPANVVHDGSDEVVGGVPKERWIDDGDGQGHLYSAARFFYCAKASRSERNAGCEGLGKKANAGSYRFREDGSLDGKPTSPKQNFHPTVKPLALMEWLVKLVAPPGGTVLDPFMGSGTTGIACGMLGHDFIGIDKDPQYVEIAKARVREHCGLLVELAGE